MTDGRVDFGNIGRLDLRLRSALAARVWIDGRRALPWNLNADERRRIHRLGLAKLGRADARGSMSSFLTPEGVALGEILLRRGTLPMIVPPMPWETITDAEIARLSDPPKV